VFLSYSQKRCLEQLAQNKGHTSCYNCGSERVGVHESESEWWLGGLFQVVLQCPDCYADDDSFEISEGEAKRCGLDPNANLPNIP